MIHKNCSTCSIPFDCSSDDGTCWCMSHAPLRTIFEGQDCRCEACLTVAIINETVTDEVDYYIENGLYVFTRSYHLKRGRCCGNGCRHCPYKKS